MLSDKGLAQWEVAGRRDLGINNKNFSKELKADKCFPSDFLKRNSCKVWKSDKTKTQFTG